MIKQLITSLILILISGACLAQSNLVLYDADGDRIGNFLGFEPDNGGYYVNMRVHTADGYAMLLEPGGALSPGVGYQSFIHYKTSDCSGQQYMIYHESTIRLARSGGQIFQLHNFNSGYFAKVEWTPQLEAFVFGSVFSIISGECAVGGEGNPNLTYFPIELVDPANYGIDANLPNSAYGFSIPFTKLMEKPPIISCNGFESCPVQ